jgi:hypothetical protein
MPATTPISGKRGRCGLVVCLTIVSAPLVAQTDAVVGARCAIDAPSLINLYGEAKAKEISTAFCEAVIRELSAHQTFRTWKYKIGATSPAATLVLRVEDGSAEDTSLILEFRQGNFTKGWSSVWRSPGDRLIDPSPSEAPDVLTRNFMAMVVAKYAREIEDKLKTVPIATARWLTRGGTNAPRLVSSLRWEEFQHLRNSLFRVRCRWDARNDDVNLESRGALASGQFEPGGKGQPYAALVVVVCFRDYGNLHTPVEQVMDELPELKPKAVYFVRYEDPDLEVVEP